MYKHKHFQLIHKNANLWAQIPICVHKMLILATKMLISVNKMLSCAHKKANMLTHIANLCIETNLCKQNAN